MTMHMGDLMAQLRAKAAIDADDTLAVRRAAWPDGSIDPAEAEAIFDLNTAVKDASPEWVDFFVEAMTAYVVAQQQPTGYVDEAKADWLLAKIDADGRVDSRGELELLVRILEIATNAPETLKAYALRQIETAVLTGNGPTRGGALDAGRINDVEVGLLRRVLFAQSGDGPAIVSRAEAELLFRIKAATLGADNAPGWKTLFVQGVGNHLMVASNYRPLARDEAARLDGFMNDTRVNVIGFLGSMMTSNPAKGLSDYRARGEAADIDAFSDDAVAAEEIAWVRAAIDADGVLDPLEEALVAFVAEERGTQLR